MTMAKVSSNHMKKLQNGTPWQQNKDMQRRNITSDTAIKMAKGSSNHMKKLQNGTPWQQNKDMHRRN